jgi:hypothetical protein
LRKALYGLKQSPRAWYGRLRGFLFERGFEMGKVDQTLFLVRQGRDILIVQVYADDIVFGGSSNSLVARFAEDMSREFEMSMMAELQFFLGLQIKPKPKLVRFRCDYCGKEGHKDEFCFKRKREERMAKEWANKDMYNPSHGVPKPRMPMPRGKAVVRSVPAWGDASSRSRGAVLERAVRPALPRGGRLDRPG